MAKGHSNRRSAARRASSDDAIALLKADHQNVSAMFERFERSRQESVKDDLAQKICDELTVHAAVEEEIFYPAVREKIGDDELMDEAAVEHASAKMLIGEIGKGRRGNDMFDAKVTVLGEYVKHHVKEEQNEIFPKARKAGVDLKDVGARIRQRKEALTAKRPT
jgi:hemerythrin superfamily protein